MCREGEYIDDVDNETSNINDAVWEIRADEFCSGGEVVRSGQRAALWQVIERSSRECLPMFLEGQDIMNVCYR